ncbi:MAG: hypothetical protein JETCAE02_13170 [Anaerolineaceae bacterium]|nr:MAG: hypothetical protein JETCAE02_13170 [Anaerolineaceae bacterium]
MAKKFTLNNVRDSKIDIKHQNVFTNAPASVTSEDVEYLLTNLEKVETNIQAGDSIYFKDLNY